MDNAKISIFSLLLLIVGFGMFFLIAERRKKKREIFSDKITALISLIKSEASIASWPTNWWIRNSSNLLREIRFCFVDYEKCLGYQILSGKNGEGCKKLDYKGDYSVEKFLNCLLAEAREYNKQKERAIREFTQINTKKRRYIDVYIKVKGDECTFLYFENDIYCFFVERIIETRTVNEAIKNSQKEWELANFRNGVCLRCSEESIEMDFRIPDGWLFAYCTRSDFEKAFKTALKK